MLRDGVGACDEIEGDDADAAPTKIQNRATKEALASANSSIFSVIIVLVQDSHPTVPGTQIAPHLPAIYWQH